MLSEIGRYLPEYLSPENKQRLVEGLKDFPNNFQYYLYDRFMGELLQGDLWSEFVVIDFDSGQRKSVKGIVLSNSCDVDESNERPVPTKVSFVPLINLNKLEQLLLSKRSQQQVENILSEIRNQKMTSFFYLPAGYGVEDEMVALLSDVHSMPLVRFKEATSKITTLSQQGFYMFLLKLSIHFCRFQEGVER